jgi:hypothetical protein
MVHLNDIAPPPTDIKFDIPLIGCTASLDEAVLLAVRKPDAQIEMRQPRAPEKSTSDASTSPPLSSGCCSDLTVFLSLTEPSSALKDTLGNILFPRSPTDGDGSDVQEVGDDALFLIGSFLASEFTSTSALSSSFSLFSYDDGSTGRL